jgi:GT2 family glycosyltransferase
MTKKSQIIPKFPMLSIALATFNGEKHLASLLESFLSQTQPVDEVIICDDEKPTRIATPVPEKILKGFSK